jgi:hypothetical protein
MILPGDDPVQVDVPEVGAEQVNDLFELVCKAEWDPAERKLVMGLQHCLMDHVSRAEPYVYGMDASTQARRGRFTPKELLTEVEKILHKSSGALSLYERLQRDP